VSNQSASPATEETAEKTVESTPEQTNCAADEAVEVPVKVIHPETVEPQTMNAETVNAPEIEPQVEINQAAEPTPAELAQEVTELKRQLAEMTEKANTYWDSLLRQKAEVENLQKRAQRDVDNARKYALEKFVGELLSVKDSMEMGLEAAQKPETEVAALREGMDLTLKMLNSTLEKFGIQEINPQDQKFDPQWHEAMAMQPVPNVEEGTIILVHQKGYQVSDRLIRPARVIVAKGA
jgi:molecular chaperone GrpE